MPGKKKRDEKADSPVPDRFPFTLTPPGWDKRPPPKPLSPEIASLKAEMLKELQRGDQNVRGILEIKRGNVSRGQYLMGKAINEVAPGDVKKMNLVGLSLYYEDKVEEALSWFQKALESDPDSPDTINNIGLCSYARGNYSDAIAKYQLAISKKADKAIFWWNLAYAKMKSNQNDATLTSLQKAFDLNDKLREEAKQEETFAPLRNHPVFQMIVKSTNASLE